MGVGDGPGIKPIEVTPLFFGQPAPGYLPWEAWSEGAFETLFANMAQDGITTIVLLGGYGDLVYYPSALLKNASDIDWYARSFDLAAQHGMQMILSGIMYTYYGQFTGDGWDPHADLAINKRAYRELHRLYGSRSSFGGWYIPQESGDRTHRGDIMVILRELPRYLKEMTPDALVSYGPWFTSRLTVGPEDATTPAQCAENWDSMLQEIEGIDVCAFQDTTAPEDEIGEWYEAISPVFAGHGIELWNVVELFPRHQDDMGIDIDRSVAFADLALKMAITDRYVTKNACWEYQNYLNPESPLPSAHLLNTEYRRWRRGSRA